MKKRKYIILISNLWLKRLRSFIVALLKSLVCTILIIIAGLFQIVLVLCICLCTDSIDFPLNKIIMSCTLLFFSTSLIASISIDYIFNKVPIQLNGLEILFYIFIPICYIVFCTVIYTTIFNADIYSRIDDIKYIYIQNAQLVLFGTILLYTLFQKIIIFYSNERRQ